MQTIAAFVFLLALLAGGALRSPSSNRAVDPAAAHEEQRQAARRARDIRISAWYWLNSAPKEEWARDFRNMADLGFTHVVMGWGIDLAAAALRVEDTRDALRAAERAGLGAYLFIWHPFANSLERRPEFTQVNVDGRTVNTFDVFNKDWRHSQWKDYLQRVARAYADEQALVGYLFDDSFMNGPAMESPALRPDSDYFSYNTWEKEAFGEPLPTSPKDPRWEAWVEARADWWEDWARDTVTFIREAEGNKGREIYLEDLDYILNPIWRDKKGIDLPRIVQHFDSFGTYTMAGWDDSPDAAREAAAVTPRVIRKIRQAIGDEKKLVYTFWAANAAELHRPGPARHPTAPEITAIIDAALAEGVTHIDLYGYRIGDANLEVDTRTPGSGPTYPLTGQYDRKFLWDRPEIHEALGAYLRGLR